VDWGRLYAESQELLDSLGVKINLKQKARYLSIAEQQMVEIARAFSVNARILIMDEPTSSLTLNEVEDLFRLVRNIRESGTSVIFISHRLEELFEIADRVTVLRDGYYVDTKSIAETSREELIRMMVGRPISDQYPKLEVPKSDVILSVENLTREAFFKDINFELKQGEILGFAGLVGAGRTDIANAIFGIEPASSGVIKLDEKPVSISSPQQAMNLGLAYVPEDRLQHGLVLDMDIIKNTTLPRLGDFSKFGWVLNKREQKAAYEIACQMEIKGNSIYQLTRELSGGNQQKVVLGKWLSINPRILILDEPTRGIDVRTKASVHKLMSELAAEGMAIILISSELPEILGMSDRIIVMREGYMTGEFSRKEATQEKILTAATEDVRARI
jgi:ABC-type sugar transport system ATPase subunit